MELVQKPPAAGRLLGRREVAITSAGDGKGSWEVAREFGAREFPESAWCIEKWFLE